MTRTCAVTSHTRRIPEKKCGLDNAIHRQLAKDIEILRETDALGEILAAALLEDLADGLALEQGER